jgi:glycosyltransferase involved in cell wall biosynthesis
VKVLFTTVSLDARRGAGTAERTRRLVEGFRAAGHDCMVATIDGGDLVAPLRDAGAEVYVTGAIRVKFTVPFINWLRLHRLVAAADIIHVLGHWNLLSVATAATARSLGKPYVFSAAGEFAALAAPRPVPRLFHELFGERMVRGAASLVAITELERTQILERFGGPADRVLVVPNGVAEPPAAVLPAPGLPGGQFILFLGRLAPIKGPDLLLQAWERVCGQHPDVTLVIAGPDFGLGSALRARTASPPLAGRVTFTDYLDERQKADAYRRAAFLVVPSRAEAMSLVALEAGTAGTPVLLTDQCGFGEVANLGGGLVVPATPEGLAAGLDSMLAPSTDLPAMGARLRQFVRDHYAWTGIVDRLAAHFTILAAGARPVRRD